MEAGALCFVKLLLFCQLSVSFSLLQALGDGDGHGDGGADHRVLTHPYNRRPLGFA